MLTVEAQAKYVGHLGGGLSKNLFLKDKKQRFYVVSALSGTNIDLKVLSQRLGLGKGGLRMAPEEALQEILQVPLGCVTPFALINESARAVSLLLDHGFKALECCFFHPLSNDTTISLSARDLDKFLTSIGRKPSYVDLEAAPVVGKDNPPDLAALVPSEVPVLPESTEKLVPVQHVSDNHVAVEKKSVNAVNVRQKVPKPVAEEPKISVDALAEATDVQKFVKELINKTSAAFLAEINKHSDDQHREFEPLVLEGVKKKITTDLENLTMSLKNAAYTQGFSSGIQTGKLKLNSMFSS